MDLWCFKFMLILVWVECVRSLPLACSYNGTSYKEGESVRTEEPCLSCVCQKGALECSLRVCPGYPDVLPPACFLVHKPNDCCPQLLCEEKFSPTGIELRTGFKLETKIHGNDCLINGSIYAEGSAVASSRVCEYCYCVEGEMKCIKPRCLQSFDGCKAVYEKSSCCPTHYDCRDADMDYLTTQIKNIAKVHPTVSSDSLRSLWSTKTTTDKEYLKGNESMGVDISKTEEASSADDILMSTTQEINTEETTVETENESTISSTEDSITTTTTGFQTTKFDSFSEQSTKVAFTEATTIESETEVNLSSFTVMENQKETSSVQTRSKMDFPMEIESSLVNNNSSSQDVDDYDSYDYSEPRLPPSLPNLVIFPFVAADAVVKDENLDLPPNYEKVGIERIDTHPVFYKDYFSPPLKTEGGFLPKEPLKPEESFYEYSHFREQIEPPSPGPGAQVQTNVTPQISSEKCVSDGREIKQQMSGECVTCICEQGAVVCKDTECPQQKAEAIIFENQKVTDSILESDSNITPDGFGEALQPTTETQSDYILKKGLTELHENHQTKKPVTVTYKNLVVDFYPNYLITTSRDHFKIQSMAHKSSEENHQHSTSSTHQHHQQTTQNTVIPLTTTGTSNFNLNKADTSITATTTSEVAITTVSTIPLTTSETSFFEEFLQSFLPKDETSEKTTTTGATATTKHKYSSKIKSQIIGTVKPKQDEIREKIKPEVNSTYAYSWSNSIEKTEDVTEKNPVDSLTVKQVETKNAKIDFSDANSKDLIEIGSENTAVKSNAGAILKLAGCNIYGMMYRVGKIITELSGPCLECLCTELGVQCRSQKC